MACCLARGRAQPPSFSIPWSSLEMVAALERKHLTIGRHHTLASLPPTTGPDRLSGVKDE